MLLQPQFATWLSLRGASVLVAFLQQLICTTATHKSGRRANCQLLGFISAQPLLATLPTLQEEWIVCASCVKFVSYSICVTLFFILAFFLITSISDYFNILGVVDIYNSVKRIWTTAELMVPRANFVAASIGGTAIFPGGQTTSSFSGAVDMFSLPTAEVIAYAYSPPCGLGLRSAIHLNVSKLRSLVDKINSPFISLH
jgi:hypothetical protein